KTTTPATTPPSCAIPTGTGWRRCSTSAERAHPTVTPTVVHLAGRIGASLPLLSYHGRNRHDSAGSQALHQSPERARRRRARTGRPSRTLWIRGPCDRSRARARATRCFSHGARRRTWTGIEDLAGEGPEGMAEALILDSE